jgi:CRP-like cAMP-binding protein
MPEISTEEIYNHFRAALANEIEIEESAWSDFVTRTTINHIQKKDSLFSIGDTDSSVYFIISGLVRLYYLNEEGKEFNKSFLKKGDIAGTLENTDYDIPATYAAECMKDGYFIKLPKAGVIELCNRHRCWHDLKQKTIEQVARKKQAREKVLLTTDATLRYQNFLNEFGDLSDEIPLFHVASYLGITNVALSRIRKRLKTN